MMAAIEIGQLQKLLTNYKCICIPNSWVWMTLAPIPFSMPANILSKSSSLDFLQMKGEKSSFAATYTTYHFVYHLNNLVI